MSARYHWSGKTFAAAAGVAATVTMAGAPHLFVLTEENSLLRFEPGPAPAK